MSLQRLLPAFLGEAEELLALFEETVLRIDEGAHDPELLHELFRVAHTLKGNAGMMGLLRTTALAHTLEELLAALRTGRVRPTPGIVATLLETGDVLRALLPTKDGQGERAHARYETVLAELTTHAGGSASPPPALTERDAGGPAVSIRGVTFTPPPDLFRRGLDTLRLLDDLADKGDLVSVTLDESRLPHLALMEPETAYVGFTCRMCTTAGEDELRAVFDFVDEPEAVHVTATTAAPVPGREPAAGAPAPHAGPVGHAEPVRLTTREAAIQSIRVATDKVDALADMVGELVISQSAVTQLVDVFTPDRLPMLREAVAQLDRQTRSLQGRVMSIRMLPMRTVFDRFSRAVHDLARAAGKRVGLEIRGEDTELDKTLIERIADPLMHLVRNAVDHGLEGPEERRARGKPETGRLRLSASQHAGKIHLEIEDDGRGLDRDRILAKARAAGAVGPADTLTDEQVWSLIFLPGLSTAERVSEVSGRGVGMDAVRRDVEAFGGRVAVTTTPGAGTTIHITLPLTLAIMDGLLVRVGTEVYVLPLIAVSESLRCTASSVHHVLGAGETLKLRGHVLPLVRLHRLFNVSSAVQDVTRAITVVLEQNRRRIALLVDELVGQQQVVIKSLGAGVQRVRGVAGATILGDGRVALIVDTADVVAGEAL